MTPETARSLLRVPATASSDDVDRAFRRLAHGRHPDRGGEAEDFRLLLQARAVLHAGRSKSPHAPLIVVHRGPWWQRLLRALHRSLGRSSSAPRVR